jgi:superfamily I DNA and RNA helicase
LFPEIKIAERLIPLPGNEVDSEAQDLQIPDLMQVMDIQQEQLARNLGDGHRVVHGVAGSGKTLILIHRCLHLAGQMCGDIKVEN